ncbi:hypothetical protein NCTGTJJY_CDS0229 [Serratia phage 92A1]|nr:hypothetical protein NCTGTJJY_CDS0229 [Serratia phage 92A1]
MKINLNATVKCKDHDGYKAQAVHESQWSLSAEQFELVYCNTPEGQSDDFSWKIVLNNWFTGQEFVLNTIIFGKIVCETYEDEDYSEDVAYYKNGRQVAMDLIEKMKAKGVLDLSNWTLI